MKPTIGRIVIYHDAEGRDVPAIVNAILADHEVNVYAFDPVVGGRNFITKGEGTGPGEWSWPPRDTIETIVGRD